MASGPGNEWQIRLDAAAEVYVASLRSTGLVFSLPRRTIEDAVFAAAEITLQLTPDGCLVVHAESSGKRSLTDAKISALVASAVTPDALKAMDDAVFLKRVEAELLSALEAVRQAAGVSRGLLTAPRACQQRGSNPVDARTAIQKAGASYRQRR